MIHNFSQPDNITLTIACHSQNCIACCTVYSTVDSTGIGDSKAYAQALSIANLARKRAVFGFPSVHAWTAKNDVGGEAGRLGP